ncbi:hypothetical protein D3Z89_01650 [Bacillus subtilis]|nr:hypothetical protein C7T97_01690 [Bacillus subtilis]RMD56989.1 hypothetical protein D3Z89_01650 [Bacillus subtilis]
MKAISKSHYVYLISIRPGMNNQVYIFQKPSFYYIFVNKRLWELPQNTYSLTLGTYIKLQQYVEKVNIV